MENAQLVKVTSRQKSADNIYNNVKKYVDKLFLFGMLKLALALQFIVTNAYFSVVCNTKVSVRATLK